MSDIISFDNTSFGKVRVVYKEQQPWFIAMDICQSLEITPRDSVRYLDDEDKSNVSSKHIGLSGGRDLLIINESGLYSLILRSRKPQAKAFKRWVTSEVLPSIRRTGSYNSKKIPQTFPEALRAYAEEVEKRQSLEIDNQIKESRINKLIHTGKTYTITELAKELGFTSASKLNKQLQKLGFQYKVNGCWVCTSKYSDKGYEQIKQEERGNKILYYRKLTGLGRDFVTTLISQEEHDEDKKS
ncbi:BRO family protein [Spirochaeta cellobiosiphila]|uniref:BRO family protein n=1 Tax=Spirochaeta cellobiosiphila TaxID=504483 RepID=UPI00041A0C2D|nr:BRO family protein [Spirochaeta cellobiosiphila]